MNDYPQEVSLVDVRERALKALERVKERPAGADGQRMLEQLGRAPELALAELAEVVQRGTGFALGFGAGVAQSGPGSGLPGGEEPDPGQQFERCVRQCSDELEACMAEAEGRALDTAQRKGVAIAYVEKLGLDAGCLAAWVLCMSGCQEYLPSPGPEPL